VAETAESRDPCAQPPAGIQVPSEEIKLLLPAFPASLPLLNRKRRGEAVDSYQLQASSYQLPAGLSPIPLDSMADHKKLIVWVAAKDLAVEVYRLVGASALARDYGLRDQLLRAAVSIPSNIAEGYARETSADRKHFLTIALGSCAELETQLLIASEVGLVASASAQALIAKVNEVSKMLFSLRRKL